MTTTTTTTTRKVSKVVYVNDTGFDIRDFGIQRLGRTLVAQLRSPVTGASYATIPGSLNVMTLASSLGRSWRRRPGDSGCWPSRPRPALACGCGCACG